MKRLISLFMLILLTSSIFSAKADEPIYIEFSANRVKDLEISPEEICEYYSDRYMFALALFADACENGISSDMIKDHENDRGIWFVEKKKYDPYYTLFLCCEGSGERIGQTLFIGCTWEDNQIVDNWYYWDGRCIGSMLWEIADNKEHLAPAWDFWVLAGW